VARPLKKAGDFMPALASGQAGVTLADMGAQVVDMTMSVASVAAINAIGNSLKTSNVMLANFYPVSDSLLMQAYMITNPTHQTVFIGVSATTQGVSRAVRMQGWIQQVGSP
jgi:hypothetical protein